MLTSWGFSRSRRKLQEEADAQGTPGSATHRALPMMLALRSYQRPGGGRGWWLRVGGGSEARTPVPALLVPRRVLQSAFTPSPVDFMVAVTVHSDFRAQEKKVCHYFYFPPSAHPASAEHR